MPPQSPQGISPAGSQTQILEHKVQRAHRKRRCALTLLFTTLALIVLALALGLGLGLGLRHRGWAGPDQGPVSSWTEGSRLKYVELEQLVDPSQFVLSPSFDVHAPPQTREYWWDLQEVIAAPGGINRRMLVVNGKFPGPTIEANLGDQIVVHVNNQLPNISAIHWHGQSQNGSNYMDGTYSVTECGISPHSRFTYNWTVQNTGTYWWHAHAGAQYSDGLFGALILHSPQDAYTFRSSSSSSPSPSPSSAPTPWPTPSSSGNELQDFQTDQGTYDGDLIVMVNDMYNLFSTDWLSQYLNLQLGSGEGAEPTPDYGVINGVGQANCDGTPANQRCVRNGNEGLYANFTVEPNRRYRVRVINAGSLASFDVSIDGHPLTVIEVDGTPVQPVQVGSVHVGVAQRTSVVIETEAEPGAYWLRATISGDMIAYDVPTSVFDQRAVLRYAGVDSATFPPLDGAAGPPALGGGLDDGDAVPELVPLDAVVVPRPTAQTVLDIDFGSSANGDFHAFFNNTAFGVPYGGYSTLVNVQSAFAQAKPVDYGGALVVTVDGVEVMDVIVNNHDDGAHPMHLHGYAPYLLGTGPGNFIPGRSMNLDKPFANPMRRDVFVVPPHSWAVVRIVTDNPGVWVFHCHLAAHMAAGLMMQFVVQPAKVAGWWSALPGDYTWQCDNMRKKGLIMDM